MNSKEISTYFEGIDLISHIEKFQNYFTLAAQGQLQNYKGKNLKEAHAHLGINNKIWDIMIYFVE